MGVPEILEQYQLRVGVIDDGALVAVMMQLNEPLWVVLWDVRVNTEVF